MSAPFNEQELNRYTDEQLAIYVREAPNMLTVREEAICVLSPSLIAKKVHFSEDPQDEVRALECAAALGVRVPTARRVIPLPDDDHAIIMDRVPGQTLEQLWPTLGLWRTLRLGWELRRVVTTLRTVKAQNTGGLHSGKVISKWVQGIHTPVPHATPAMFTDYLNWWLVHAYPTACTPFPNLTLKTPSHHVLVHQDLVPRNMILDDSDRLWIVDWGRSGYFPAIAESLTMADGPYSRDQEIVHSKSWLAWYGRLRWTVVRVIACGWHSQYESQRYALGLVEYRSNRFRLGRPPNATYRR